MAHSRLELQELLEEFTPHVYFQPPTNTAIVYPCIVYEIDGRRTEYAGNGPYRHTKRYSVTVIDRNPDSPICDKIADLPLSSFDRHFPAENLHHTVFNLYF